MNTPQYQDDPTVADPDPLWRRIPPYHLVPDGAGGIRISSASFDNDPDGDPMSVVLGLEVTRANRAPSSCLKGLDDFGLAAITAGIARENKQGIQRDATEEEPAHALVFGRKTDSIRKKFARSATRSWVVRPPEHIIEARRR
jgi:hypothetical protein